jgi:type IV secretion system protein VirD4
MPVSSRTEPELQTATPRRDLDAHRPRVVLLLGAGVLGSWAGTQYLAYRLAYHPNLGPRLYALSSAQREFALAAAIACAAAALLLGLRPATRRFAPLLGVAAAVLSVASVGPIYGPFRLLRWSLVYRGIPTLAPILSDAVLMAAGVTIATTLGGLLALGSGPRRVASASHGTARWGDGAALRREEGLLLGRHISQGGLLRFGGEGHLLTLAPTRSGKGVSAVIPNLLDHLGSVLVTDVKPELAAVAARRRREMGQEVRILDPYGAVGGWDGFNPLDLIDIDSPDAIDDARMLMDMMIDAAAEHGENVHWNETAREFGAGLLLHIRASASPEDRHLLHFRKLATLRRGTPRAPGPVDELLARMQDSRAAEGLVSRAAAVLHQKPLRERGSVISSLHRHTEFLDSPRLRQVLGRSTFDLADLKRRRVSIFLSLPSDRLPEYHRWIRLMVGCAVRVLMRTPGRPEHRVLIALDEFQNLGRLGPVEQAVSMAAGFGVQFWLFVQDLARLKDAYPRTWETFFTNSDVLQAFGASNDRTTSDYLSWLTGEATVFTESENQSRGVSHGKASNTQRGTGQTVSEKGRRLLTPDEVRRLDRGLQLLFLKGSDPILARRLDYRDDPEFRGQFDPNPQYDAVPA